MPRAPKRSELALVIELPEVAGQQIRYQTADGERWSASRDDPPQTMHTEVLWQRIVTRWSERREIVTNASAALGAWLMDERAEMFVRSNLARWQQEKTPRRIELLVPHRLSDWPWEIMATPAISPLAVHQALTLVRKITTATPVGSTPPPLLEIELIGVQLNPTGDVQELDTAGELEVLREQIEHVGRRALYRVGLDLQGCWSALAKRYQEQGPPHVFHFAGHGLKNGKGLIFRDDEGRAAKILADRIATLLTHRDSRRHTLLAFLNACSTATTGRGPYQPFGGLGPLLLERGVPAVIGMHTPVLDAEASTLSRVFYQAIAHGDTVDCALQAARHSVFIEDRGGIAWAFVSLCCAGDPSPLIAPTSSDAAPGPSTTILEFGHEEQRNRARRFMTRRSPMVIVIHGTEGMGHLHVARRVQHDLEAMGNVLWRPVATMRLFMFGGEPLLQQTQLAGAIARALSVDDTGTLDELKNRLASVIAERCTGDRVLVLSMEEVLKPIDEDHANALITLVHKLWTEIVDAATRLRDILPVFLVLCVGYPRELPDSDRRAKRARKRVEHTRKVIENLSKKRRLGRVRVEVLPELQPFSDEYVTTFLEEVVDIDINRAEAIAENLVSAGDNDEILRYMDRLLTEWREP